MSHKKDTEDLAKTYYEQGMAEVCSKVHKKLLQMPDSGFKEDLLTYLNTEFEGYVPIYGTTEPTAYEKKFNYLTTYKYRGIPVDIYIDDYGQQYYFYYKGISHGCGTYNLNYKDSVQYLIDRELDSICNFGTKDDRFYGAYCRYSNHEHTEVEFTFRGEVIDTYEVDTSDPDSVTKICEDCESRLIELFNNPDFLRAEEERKSGINLNSYTFPEFAEYFKQDEKRK